MDWVSRRVLAWRLSNTMEADFCVEALEEALVRFGRPEIPTHSSNQIHRQHPPMPTLAAQPKVEVCHIRGDLILDADHP
ncbi:MAG: putative transposase [Rhodospirillaceae bacterium]|nr:MAG: putative transposase [Rhodospirillaceae bacterium]